MMMYKYRWFYSLLLSASIIFSALYLDIIPHYLALKSLQQSYFDLLRKSQALEKLDQPHLILAQKKNDDPLAALISMMRLKGLLVQSTEIKPAKMENANEILSARFAAQGSFASLFAFIADLPKQSFSSALNYFSLRRASQNQLNIVLGITVFKTYYSLLAPLHASPFLINPFCMDENLFVPYFKKTKKVSDLKLPATPLAYLKMVGYLHQNQRTAGLVSAPNNTTIDVTAGDLLGQEKGRVKSIFPDRIALLLPNKKSYDLVMKREN